jgi:hypothetical protein
MQRHKSRIHLGNIPFPGLSFIMPWSTLRLETAMANNAIGKGRMRLYRFLPCVYKRQPTSTLSLVVIVVMMILSLLDAVPVVTAQKQPESSPPSSSSSPPPSCVVEFDRCVTNRDCCQGLECIAGDWQYTTDSTCLSHRSRHIEESVKGMTIDDKVRILQTYYDATAKKPLEEITKIAYRYRHDFPKLVSRLERKYGLNTFPDIDTFRRQQEQHRRQQHDDEL